MIVGIDARAANVTTPLGVGVYCQELIRAMAAIPDAPSLRLYLDAEPCPDFPVEREQADIRILPRGFAWTTLRLARELRREPPDVFFAPVMQVPFGVPCPVVTTSHGLPFQKYGASPNLLRRVWAALRTLLILWRCNRIIAISDSMKADMVNVLRTAGDRVAVIPHGCSPGFRPDLDPGAVARVRERYELPERYVLYCGRIGMHKNLVRLIDAFTAVRTRHPDLQCQLILAGSTQLDSAPIRAAAERSAMKDDIRFIGYVDRRDLPALMAGAQALALVSHWESFGMPALEAMASGTPVVAANCGALPEVCGDAAVLVDPSDTKAIEFGLERLLTDEAYRLGLRDRGLQRAAEFSWGRTGRETLRVIRTEGEDTAP
ncbi:MAG: glycosyltransferase family 4 protein [Candidatus Hydrogenedentes bacterium]|nr:glycosyltransferase family 4 protein [Candidatus Hydrogenedentota bacterium]